jgi:hypothetical protein
MQDYVPAGTVDVHGREIQLWGRVANRFDGETTNRADFVPHKLEARPPAAAPHLAGAHTSGQHYSHCCTFARSECIAHNASCERRLVYMAGHLAFEGESTMRAEYPAHPLPERQNFITTTYKPSPAPFDGL